MEQVSLTIPEDSLLEMLRFQPESVLMQLFDKLLVISDSSPITEEEKMKLSRQDQKISKVKQFNGKIDN